MPSRELQLFGLTRVAYGAFVLARPAAGARSWLGPLGENTGSEVLMRSVGARDAAVGLALAAGVGNPATVAKGAIALDLADLVATWTARERLPQGQLVKVAAVIGAYAAITALLVARTGGG